MNLVVSHMSMCFCILYGLVVKGSTLGLNLFDMSTKAKRGCLNDDKLTGHIKSYVSRLNSSKCVCIMLLSARYIRILSYP